MVAFLYGLTFGLTAFLLPLPFPYYVNFDWEADVRTQVEGQPAGVRTYRKRFETKLLSMTVWGPLVRRDQVGEHLGSYLGAAVREQVYADYDVYAGLVPVLRNGSPADVRRFLAEHPTRNAARAMSDLRLTRRELLAAGLALGADLVVDPAHPPARRAPGAGPADRHRSRRHHDPGATRPTRSTPGDRSTRASSHRALG